MIEVRNISKWFGARQVLRDVSFEVEKGEILGFLGPNGAGKTTSLRILTGYFPPDKGTVKIGGYNITQNPLAVKQKLGYFPEHNPLYPEMTVDGYLRFVARIKGVRKKEETKRVNTVVAECGLENVRHRLIKRLSKGYKQRVGLAQALVNDPEVLLLDEPTIGLDPKQIYEIDLLFYCFSLDLDFNILYLYPSFYNLINKGTINFVSPLFYQKSFVTIGSFKIACLYGFCVRFLTYRRSYRNQLFYFMPFVSSQKLFSIIYFYLLDFSIIICVLGARIPFCDIHYFIAVNASD